MKSSRTLFVRYLCLNLILVGLASAVILALLRAPLMWWGIFQIAALIVLPVQYPLLRRTSSWSWRFAIFFFGMLMGLFLSGTILAIIQDGGLHPSAGAITLIFGLIYGFIPCVFIVLVNWLLEKHVFPKN
jgi:hypothetical protein